MSDIPRKNGWQIQAREDHPYGIQRLLSRAVWNHDAVRDVLRDLVCQTVHLPSGASSPVFPALAVDESGCPKRGRHSAGVAHQYCGASGTVENCQVGVFLSYVTQFGHALIDRELYVPQEWCADRPRCRAAHLPDDRGFQTKPELAIQMIQRARQAGFPFQWVVGNTVYGHSSQLRTWLLEQGICYALAVPCIEVVSVQTPTGPLLGDVASIARLALRSGDWQRFPARCGTQGEQLFEWARLLLLQAGAPDDRHWLLVRRCLDDPSELAFILVWAPPNTTLFTLAQVYGARWSIEEDLQTAKALGLDQYEVRSFVGWYRHITLVLLAAAFLLSCCLHAPSSLQEGPSDSSPPLIAWTPSEVQHLLAHLIFPPPTSVPLILQWSLFRRPHQYWAGYSHRRRRLKACFASC